MEQTESFSNIQGLQLCLSGDSNVLNCISFLGIVVVDVVPVERCATVVFHQGEKLVCVFVVEIDFVEWKFSKMHRTNNGVNSMASIHLRFYAIGVYSVESEWTARQFQLAAGLTKTKKMLSAA